MNVSLGEVVFALALSACVLGLFHAFSQERADLEAAKTQLNRYESIDTICHSIITRQMAALSCIPKVDGAKK